MEEIEIYRLQEAKYKDQVRVLYDEHATKKLRARALSGTPKVCRIHSIPETTSRMYCYNAEFSDLLIESGLLSSCVETLDLKYDFANINIRCSFNWSSYLKELTITGNVHAPYAFANCKNLTSVKLNDVNEISYHQFENCESLEHIEVPECCSHIHMWAFSYCKNLRSLVFKPRQGEQVYRLFIESGAFSSTALRSVALPEWVTYRSGAFPDCCKITRI